MKRKIVTLSAALLVSASSLLGAVACGGLQDEVESPVRGATQQVQKARDAQQKVEGVQQQQQRFEEGQ